MQTKSLLKATLALLLLAGCSNEELVRQTDGSLYGNVPEGMTEYQFKLSGITPTTSYAPSASYAAPAMTANEMAINDLTVYVCEDKGDVASEAEQDAVDILGTYEAKITGNVASILIPSTSFDDATFTGISKLRFVLVANKAWTNLAWSSWYKNDGLGLSGTDIAVSTYGDLRNNVNSVWAVFPVDAGINYPEGGGLPMYAIVKGQDVPSKADVLNIKDVKLKRSVARLDIRNSANQHLQIGAIGFMMCRTIGPLFKPAEFVEMGDVTAMAAMDASYQAVKNLNDATLLDGGGAIPYQEGMFYLHPRKDGDQLVLIIQGTLDFGIGAQDVAYEIPIATKIAANTRYRMDIKLNERNEIVVSSVYSVEDWGDLGDSELEHTVIQPAVNDKNLKALAAEGAYKGQGGVESYEMSFVGGTGTEELVTDPDHTSDNILKAIAVKPAAYAVNFRTWTITTNAGEVGTAYFILQRPAADGTGDPTVLGHYSIKVPKNIPAELLWTTPLGEEWESIKVGSLIWAPANMGAEAPEEPGFIYQWGRPYSWENVAKTKENVHAGQISNVAESTTTYANQFITTTASPNFWYSGSKDADDFKALEASWTAVSDGSNNPCPIGWRLPTPEELVEVFKDLGNADAGTDGKYIRKSSSNAITWVVYQSASTGSGGLASNYSVYMCGTYKNFFEVKQTGGAEKLNVHSGNDAGASIRCVKDAVTPAP